MPLGCEITPALGYIWLRRKLRSSASVKGMVLRLASAMELVLRMAAILASTVAGSTASGASPRRPRRMARSVAWPMPVRASEPYRSTVTVAVFSRRDEAASSRVKRRAARMGPTVWELEGPIPILKSSKRLVFTVAIVGGGGWFWPGGVMEWILAGILPGISFAI